MYKFLDTPDYKKLQILAILENNADLMALKIIGEQLDLSSYQLTKCIEMIEADVQHIDTYNEPFKLEIKNKHIRLVDKPACSIVNAFGHYYAKNSRFAPFIKSFLVEDVIRQRDFLENNFISQTSFFEIKNDLAEKLGMIDIQISPKLTLFGDELFIRSFFYNYYLNFHQDPDFPMPADIKAKTIELMDELTGALNISLTHTDQIKLMYYLSVSARRLEHEHFIDENIVNRKSYKKNKNIWPADLLDKTFTILTKHYPTIAPAHLKTEASAFLNCLYAENMMSINFETLPHDPDLAKLINLFEDSVSATFNLEKIFYDDIFDAEFQENLQRFFFRLVNYGYPQATLFDVENLTFLETQYSKLFAFAHAFVQQMYHALHGKVAFFKLYQAEIAYDLLFLLISNPKIAYLAQTVHIAIDFTYGKAYNDYIKKNIISLKSLRLIVSDHVTDETDILISNHVPDYENVLKLQWTNPPTTNDWDDLRNILLTIKETKNL
ncbi:MAG: helix-turn-helix domain-containing protein [Lactobacillaceae bacterium]|jgi:hypothetical protein|nr:helix-turn-helix domain-containing protein [Lactobacillaceae bacterium]